MDRSARGHRTRNLRGFCANHGLGSLPSLRESKVPSPSCRAKGPSFTGRTDSTRACFPLANGLHHSRGVHPRLSPFGSHPVSPGPIAIKKPTPVLSFILYFTKDQSSEITRVAYTFMYAPISKED